MIRGWLLQHHCSKSSINYRHQIRLEKLHPSLKKFCKQTLFSTPCKRDSLLEKHARNLPNTAMIKMAVSHMLTAGWSTLNKTEILPRTRVHNTSITNQEASILLQRRQARNKTSKTQRQSLVAAWPKYISQKNKKKILRGHDGRQLSQACCERKYRAPTGDSSPAGDPYGCSGGDRPAGHPSDWTPCPWSLSVQTAERQAHSQWRNWKEILKRIETKQILIIFAGTKI